MRRTTLAAVFGLIACATIAPAHAIVLSDGASDADSQALANSFAYSSVGQVFYDNGGTAYSASAVMVAPGWLLTAAHVTDGASNLSFYADAGGTSGSGRTGIAADAYYTDPLWNGNLNDGYDIGLVHLTSNPACLTAATCQLATLYTGNSDVGRTAIMIGYGRTGTGSTGDTSFDGLKRSGSNSIDQLYGTNNNILLADFDNGTAADNSTGSSTPVTNEAMIAPGDSGGGLFEIIGGVQYLVGIASFVAATPADGNPNADYGDLSGWTRVSDFTTWVNDTIAANTPVPVPEPMSLALLGIGLVGIGVLRRRKAS